jgi:hypothetical protein
MTSHKQNETEDDLILFLEAVKEVNSGEETEFLKSELEVRNRGKSNDQQE